MHCLYGGWHCRSDDRRAAQFPLLSNLSHGHRSSRYRFFSSSSHDLFSLVSEPAQTKPTNWSQASSSPCAWSQAEDHIPDPKSGEKRTHSPRTCTFTVAEASIIQASQFRDSLLVSPQENISNLSTPREADVRDMHGFPCPDLPSMPQTPAPTPPLGLSPRVGSHWRPSD